MKKIIFIRSPTDLVAAYKYIDLSSENNFNHLNEQNLIDLSSIYSKYGKKWLEDFSLLLSELNRENSSMLWWAYTSTAKNLLSSPLGDRYVQVNAVCEIVKREDINVLYILGATPGQMQSIASTLSDSNVGISGNAWKLRHLYKIVEIAKTFARQPIICAHAFFGFFGHRIDSKKKLVDVCIFTYLDGELHDEKDNYFGKLPQLIKENLNVKSTHYLAYVYPPFRRRMQMLLRANNKTPYIALFGMLEISDYISVLTRVTQNWLSNSLSVNKYFFGKAKKHSSLFFESFLHDIAVGGFLHNLLIYKSIGRYLKVYEPKFLIYPYENKALEKMILLGVYDSQSRPEVIGYQHTSITPRHITLFFNSDEAKYTPLPDKIITVGSVTREYLEKNGNYPKQIFATGCALRQSWPETLPHRNDRVNTRVLLALSSSVNELIQAVTYLQKVMILMPNIELGIRPHINFPLAMLPDDLLYWVNSKAQDFSGTLLEDNLFWCSATVYVSSTVALETLMRGKPIINFSVGDMISPDPVIGEVPFHWCVNNESEMVNILSQLKGMSESYYEDCSLRAINYVRDYLKPIDNAGLQEFICKNNKVIN